MTYKMKILLSMLYLLPATTLSFQKKFFKQLKLCACERVTILAVVTWEGIYMLFYVILCYFYAFYAIYFVNFYCYFYIFIFIYYYYYLGTKEREEQGI
jgi:hypothetical protein